MYSLESPHRGDSNEYIQIPSFIEHQQTSLFYYHLLPDPGAMINHQWHELSMSRINFHGPKDVRAIEIFTTYTKVEKRELHKHAICLQIISLRAMEQGD